MKILIFLTAILLVACSGKKEINTKEIPFEAITKNMSVPSVEEEITVGEATTKILDTGINRVSNINVACKSVSGTILESGEEFSFNKTTGARSRKNGYKDAPIIFHGEKSYGVGGGVCQVSTTIYMAAKNANLKITEHHRHSENVAYAPAGNDATVVFGEKDFRFVNNTGERIYIYAWVEGERLCAKIIKKASAPMPAQSEFGN